MGSDQPSDSVKGNLISQAFDFVKTKPTTEILLLTLIAGLVYLAKVGIPYMLDRMDGTIVKIEASHSESQRETAGAFRETLKEIREDRKADRAEFREWMKSRPERRMGDDNEPPEGFIGFRHHEASKGVKGGVD